MNIAIIGAGITGLSAAHTLAKKGHAVTVFEKASVVGGLGTYVPVKGNYIEAFYHHFFQSDTGLIALTKELGISSKLKFYSGNTGIFFKDNLYKFNSATDLLTFKPLALIDRIRCGILMAFCKVIPFELQSLDTITSESWIKKIAGIKVFTTIWQPLLKGKFDAFASKIPALWLWARIKDRSLKLGYFDGSTKVLFEALIKAIQKNKGAILTGVTIEKAAKTKSGVTITVDRQKMDFDKVLFTTVSPVTAALCQDMLPAKLTSNLQKKDHLGAVCVIVELKKKVQDLYWISVCDTNSPVLVVVEHTNLISPKKYGGRHIIYLANYIHYSRDGFNLPEDEIIKTYTGFLKTLNPEFDESWILSAKLARVPRTQSLFFKNALKNIPPLQLDENIYMANIDHMYPHDRNLNLGVKLGQKVANLI